MDEWGGIELSKLVKIDGMLQNSVTFGKGTERDW